MDNWISNEGLAISSVSTCVVHSTDFIRPIIFVKSPVVLNKKPLWCSSPQFPNPVEKKMATVTATTPITPAAFLRKPSAGISSSPVLGLPTMEKRGIVRCSMEGKQDVQKTESTNKCMSASLMAAVCAATMSSPAMALVDERLNTEGLGLPFGLSNNLLGWILFGVFGLIWALYFVYTSSLEEDEESGLSL